MVAPYFGITGHGRRGQGLRRVAVLMLAPLLLGACSSIPRDAADSLADIRGGEVLVGAALHPPFVEVTGDGAPTGTEVELIEAWAEDLNATVAWETGSETVLVGKLADGELDVVIGGFDDQTNWSNEVAMTRPYGTGPDGTARVVLTEPGENALLVDLEVFLMDQAGGQ